MAGDEQLAEDICGDPWRHGDMIVMYISGGRYFRLAKDEHFSGNFRVR